ncbi:ESX-1 secretion-associated protein [Mycobacterium sp. 21AC1]|uniref:type VII secretion target n=1 Tax=[Mycobacterium] appelbergii TaxID=2939269 RepID=UPI002938F4BA|nr:type VII secretion target [Mycobacterium sp. 21AC1]MDV3127440.1 ESX-1 secretion-associated protein [Mycobacterium sp. 21AC1]
MGEVHAARVDIVALLDVARRYDTVADIVDAAIRTRLNRPVFGSASAGQAHAVHGDAVRAALDELTDPLRQWVRAANEIAAELRSSAGRYADADALAASRVR